MVVMVVVVCVCVASGASDRDLHPLFQVGSSLHEIVPHRNKVQKSALTLQPASSPRAT